MVVVFHYPQVELDLYFRRFPGADSGCHVDGNPGSLCALLPLSQPAFVSFDLETSQLSVYHYYLHPTHAKIREMDESESIQMVLE